MGLIVYVYRSNLGDCTNGGPSSKANNFTLTNVEGPFEPQPQAPAAVLLKGSASNSAIIVPEALDERRTMFGGNYAASSDSRLADAIETTTGHRFDGAIAIHDRIES